MEACYNHGDILIIDALLKTGHAHPNYINEYGQTALMLACKYNRFNAVNALLQLETIRIRPEVRNNEGNTALMLACKYSNHNIAQLLLSKLGSVCVPDLPNNEGKTVLMSACQRGYTDIVDILIGLGVKVNHVDNDGNTALMYMVCGNMNLDTRKKIVDALVASGARLDIKNNIGYTALTYMCYCGYIDTINLLLMENGEKLMDDYYIDAIMTAKNNNNYDETIKVLLEFAVQYPVLKTKLEATL